MRLVNQRVFKKPVDASKNISSESMKLADRLKKNRRLTEGTNDLTNEELKDLVRLKRKSCGEKDCLPTAKAGLHKMYEGYFLGPKRRLTHVTSPDNLDDEEDDVDENLRMI